ncbi:sperm acrosome-associated protein 5 isoform 3-T3 [Hipposideros larvatus]
MLALKYLCPGEESSSIPLKPLVFVVVLYLCFSLMCVCNKDGAEEYDEVPSPPASMFRNLSLRSLLIEPRVPEYPVHGESGARSQIVGLVVDVIMRAWGTVIVILTMLMVATVDTKIYGRCNLAMKLEKAGLNGFLGYSIGDWLCVAHYESGFDTSFVDHNPDGSSEYGIFQLNSAWWCDNGITPTLNLCHMECRGETFSTAIFWMTSCVSSRWCPHGMV